MPDCEDEPELPHTPCKKCLVTPSGLGLRVEDVAVLDGDLDETRLEPGMVLADAVVRVKGLFKLEQAERAIELDIDEEEAFRAPGQAVRVLIGVEAPQDLQVGVAAFRCRYRCLVFNDRVRGLLLPPQSALPSLHLDEVRFVCCCQEEAIPRVLDHQCVTHALLVDFIGG